MKALSVVIMILALGFFSQAGAKKKQCNDLKVSQCKKRTDCSWIKKSKGKDGKERKAYCRKSAKKK